MSFDPYEFDRTANGGYPMELHLSNTFLWMFLGLMVTFGVAIAGWRVGIGPFIFSTVGSIALLVVQLVVVVAMTAMIEKLSVGAAKACFVAYSALTGLTFTVYFYMFELGSLIFENNHPAPIPNSKIIAILVNIIHNLPNRHAHYLYFKLS